MSYVLESDELAIIIKPKDYDNPDGWAGDVVISLMLGADPTIPVEVQAHIMNIATIMTASLDLAREYPDLYDEIEEHRNYLMGIDSEGHIVKEKVEVEQEGNIYTVSRWTKK